MNQPIVVVINDGVVDKAIQCHDSDHAETVFRREAAKCREVTDDDVENGYVEWPNGSVCLTWPISDEELLRFDDGAIYKDDVLLGEFDNSKFVPSKALLEMDSDEQARVEAFASEQKD